MAISSVSLPMCSSDCNISKPPLVFLPGEEVLSSFSGDSPLPGAPAGKE